MYLLVAQFNQEILGLEQAPVGPMSNAFAQHLENALKEEADEFIDAHNNGDFIKQIDSLIDSLYFAYGGLYKLGLSDEQVADIFAAVHNCNMNKKKGVVAKRAIEGSVDAIKPENWVSPEEAIAAILDRK